MIPIEDPLLYAINNRPSLLLDCSNCANPHFLEQEQLTGVYVIPIDLLYVYRNVLKQIPTILTEIAIQKKVQITTIIITKTSHLFHYQDEEENDNIFNHCQELLEKLDRQYTIAIHHGTHRLEPTHRH